VAELKRDSMKAVGELVRRYQRYHVLVRTNDIMPKAIR
jgi:hypothetical protein